MKDILNKRELNKYRVGDIRVYLVNGSFVRKHHFTGFTMGGHNWIYNFIPEYEVWIDDSMTPYEQKMTIYHEFVEIPPMARGIPYEDAHEHYANPAEGKARHDGKLDEHLENAMENLKDIVMESSHFNGHIHHKKKRQKHTMSSQIGAVR